MTRAQKITGAVCFLACGVMAVASFMPWLSSADSTWSGWDLVRHQRDVGANPFVVWDFMTADDGGTVPFLTGLVTLISALWLAAWTALLLAVRARRDPESGLPRLLAVVGLVAIDLGAVGGLENAYFYLAGASASDASLKAGLVLLWGATLVAFAASLLTHRQAAIQHGSTAHPSPS